MNKKTVLSSAVALIIIIAVASEAAFYLYKPAETPQTPTGKQDFTVTGASDCQYSLAAPYPQFTCPSQQTLTVNTN